MIIFNDINECNGLSYHDNFIDKNEEIYLIDYMNNIEYNRFDSKYYGYTHKYNSSNGNRILNIPKTLNLIDRYININYNQMIGMDIKYNKSFKIKPHSDIFKDNIIIISISNNNYLTIDNKTFRLNRRSILIIEHKLLLNDITLLGDKSIKRNRKLLIYKNIKVVEEDKLYFN